jgi:hypothetical protein
LEAVEKLEREGRVARRGTVTVDRTDDRVARDVVRSCYMTSEKGGGRCPGGLPVSGGGP